MGLLTGSGEPMGRDRQVDRISATRKVIGPALKKKQML